MGFLKFFEKIYLLFDLLGVKFYRWQRGFSIWLSRKIRILKRIQYRRSIYAAGFCFGKKIGSRKIMHFFVVKTYKLNALKSNILATYIARELLLYFLVCFAFFFVVFFVNQILLLAETILKKRVPVSSVLKLIVYCLPAIIAQSAPFATLVGFLMCLGRLVTDNEVLIFRASGQRYSLILKAVLSMGMVISIFSFIMNDYFLPLGTLHYNRLFKQIIVSNPAIELESMSIKRMNDSTLVIGMVNKSHVSDLLLFDKGADGNERVIIAKDSLVEKATDPGVLMQLDMHDSLVLMMDKASSRDYETISSGKLILNIFENSIITSNGGTSPREMTSWDLAKKINVMKKDSTITHKKLNSFNLEFNKKFSIPFGSIFFAMLAFPLSLVFGRKDGQTLGLIFGIILSVLYWAATILGQMFGIRGGYNGFWMMWTPNLVIGLIGILLYLRLKTK